MLRTRIKICGITDPLAAQAAAVAGADAIGLVFVAGSPRCISVAAARRIVAALPAMVEPVGLFADHAADDVRAIADALRLRTVQLHGEETPEVVSALAPLRVIKAWHFDEDLAGDVLASWASGAGNLAAFLWDAPPDERAHLTGGHGRSFNWEALASLLGEAAHADPPPVMLAGGLTATNVGEAIRTVQPYGVDVSSGVERARGVKDPAAIAAFCQAVREADTRLARTAVDDDTP